MRETSYTLLDFHLHTYLQGGLTIKQVYALFENIQKVKGYEMKFQAGIHGVELKDKAKQSEPSAILEDKVPLFGDPEAYEKLSSEDREHLTEKMMGKHKNWVRGGLLK